MSSDPFDLLRADLERAAARAAARAPLSRRSRWKHPLALIAVGLALTGTATAGILTVTAKKSAPLSGTIPGDRGPSAGRYSIKLSPDLTAGHTGWCFDLAYSHGPAPVGRATGCFPAPASTAPLLNATLATLGGRSVNAIITTPQVAAVRLSSGITIKTRAYTQLPHTMRAAVLVRPTGSRRLQEQHFTLLDPHGRVLRTGPSRQAPTGAPALATSRVTAKAQARYAIINRPSPDLVVRGQDVVAPASVAAGGNVSGAFLSVAEATYDFDGRRMHAAVLVNAAAPRDLAPPLPGQRPTSTTGVYTSADITAQRAGPAWLTVTGATPNLRRRLLALLRTGR